MRNHLDLFISLLLIQTIWLDTVACWPSSGKGSQQGNDNYEETFASATEYHFNTEAPATKDITPCH